MPYTTVYIWTVSNDGAVVKSLTNIKTSYWTSFNETGTYEVMVQDWDQQNNATLFNATATIIITS